MKFWQVSFEGWYSWNIIQKFCWQRHLCVSPGNYWSTCYKPNTISISKFLEYPCDCANGSRAVGCCSHIATIVYYLAHTRYLSMILKPAEFLSEMFQQDSIMPLIEDSSDDDWISLQKTLFMTGERAHDDQAPWFVRGRGGSRYIKNPGL